MRRRKTVNARPTLRRQSRNSARRQVRPGLGESQDRVHRACRSWLRDPASQLSDADDRNRGDRVVGRGRPARYLPRARSSAARYGSRSAAAGSGWCRSTCASSGRSSRQLRRSRPSSAWRCDHVDRCRLTIAPAQIAIVPTQRSGRSQPGECASGRTRLIDRVMPMLRLRAAGFCISAKGLFIELRPASVPRRYFVSEVVRLTPGSAPRFWSR